MKATKFTVGVLSCGSILAALAGCATPQDRPDVPANSMQVSSGGKVVAFTAPHDGKAYLRDDSNNRVVYSTELKKDQVMRFDPVSDTVQIDGKSVPEGIADPGHDHSIFFTKSDMPDSADAVATHAVNDDANKNMTTVHVPIGVQVDVQPQPQGQPQTQAPPQPAATK
jgi:hypothetical protein